MGNVSIGNTNPQYTLDVSGSVQISNSTRTNKITEQITNNIVGNTTNTLTIDYNSGGLFFIGNAITTAFTSNFSIAINNINPGLDTFRTFVVTLISDVSGNTNKYYGNTIIIDGNTYVPSFLNGSTSISINTATSTVQQVSVIYTSGVWRVFTNVSPFY